jgi:hypothetical protein
VPKPIVLTIAAPSPGKPARAPQIRVVGACSLSPS